MLTPGTLSVHPNYYTSDDTLSRAPELKKQVECLLSENKTLRTNMHWLTKELKSEKQKNTGRRRVRTDSDSLEEGGGGLNSSNEAEERHVNIIKYVEKLHKTINTLKHSLQTNTKILDDIIQKRTGSKSIHSSSNVKIHASGVTDERNVERHHAGSMLNVLDDELYNLPSLEAADVTVSLGNDTNLDTTTGDSTCIKIEKHKKLYPSMWTAKTDLKRTCSNEFNIKGGVHKEGDQYNARQLFDADEMKSILTGNIDGNLYEINLPPSLLHNVKLQQTQTYLTSKKLRIPSLYRQHSIEDACKEDTMPQVDESVLLPRGNMAKAQEGRVMSSSENKFGSYQFNAANINQIEDFNLPSHDSEFFVRRPISEQLYSRHSCSQNNSSSVDDFISSSEQVFRTTDAGSILSGDEGFN